MVLAYRPQLAELVRSAPSGDEWFHEIKFDGYRLGCLIDGERVTLLSRNGRNWTGRLPEICHAARELGVKRALLDGEAAIVLADGRTSFQALQNAFGGGSRAGLVYYAFDLLHLDGQDLTGRPLEERKAQLLALLRRAEAVTRIRFSEHVTGNGEAVWREACRLRLEGIVSKRRTAPYRPGRHGDWVKVKCLRRQEFVIGGFTDQRGSREGLGALLIGYYARAGGDGPARGRAPATSGAGTAAGNRLVFAGRVGTGFTRRMALSLRSRLDARLQSDCPFDAPLPGPLGRRAHWVRPDLVADVAFSEWTAGGMIRQPSFQGLREDRAPRQIAREAPGPIRRDALARTGAGRAPARSGEAIEVQGVRLTHPDRLLYPDIGLTKLDLARYYEAVADWILPQVEGRPLTLVRCPRGLAAACFYAKRPLQGAPAPLRRVPIEEKAGTVEYLAVDSLPGLIALVQMDVLEIHSWNSTRDHVEHPDRIVFDIDPGEHVRWTDVVHAARLVRSVLQAFDLASYVKTTGGRGLHVVVPLAPRHDWSDCLAFARGIAGQIARHDPARFTTSFRKAGRESKMLLDYLRNTRGNTSVAAFSPRARPGAPVSTPLGWPELSGRLRPDRHSVRGVPRRLARLKTDPWEDYGRTRQRLTAAAIRAATGG